MTEMVLDIQTLPETFFSKISTQKEKKHKTTKERLIEFYGVNYNKIHSPQAEINWGKPAGKELW